MEDTHHAPVNIAEIAKRGFYGDRISPLAEADVKGFRPECGVRAKDEELTQRSAFAADAQLPNFQLPSLGNVEIAGSNQLKREGPELRIPFAGGQGQPGLEGTQVENTGLIRPCETGGINDDPGGCRFSGDKGL